MIAMSSFLCLKGCCQEGVLQLVGRSRNMAPGDKVHQSRLGQFSILGEKSRVEVNSPDSAMADFYQNSFCMDIARYIGKNLLQVPPLYHFFEREFELPPPPRRTQISQNFIYLRFTLVKARREQFCRISVRHLFVNLHKVYFHMVAMGKLGDDVFDMFDRWQVGLPGTSCISRPSVTIQCFVRTFLHK